MIVASLSEGGTEPAVREVLMMLIMREMREGRQALMKGDSTGSRWQVSWWR